MIGFHLDIIQYNKDYVLNTYHFTPTVDRMIVIDKNKAF